MESKMKVVMMIMTCLMISLAATLVVKCGVIRGLSASVDTLKEATEEKEMNAVTITGTIFDECGEKLAYSDSINGRRQYVDPYIYSSLLSYHSGGLEYLYNKELSTHGDKEYEDRRGDIYYKGGDIWLTLDNSLQEKVYALIKDESDASVVVLDKNGAVKVMVSSKNFNINSVDDNYNEIASEDGALMNPAKYISPCGSVLKPIIGEALIDCGKEDFMVNDTGNIVIGNKGERIRNAGNSAHGNIRIDYAMKVSSNVFFISAANEVGEAEIASRYREFKIGESFDTDFGKISSKMTLLDKEYELAYAAIGQNVGLSTVQLAMIIKGITTGEVVKPYVVKKIIKDDKVIERGEQNVFLKTSASEKSISEMNGILHNCAESYGLSEKVCSVKVLAKTGTAEVETDKGTQNVATLLIAFPADNPQFFAAIQSRNTEKWGKNLVGIGVELVNLIQ